eukprot:gene2717-24215_t
MLLNSQRRWAVAGAALLLVLLLATVTALVPVLLRRWRRGGGRWRADAPPPFWRRWGAHAGECFDNLRSHAQDAAGLYDTSLGRYTPVRVTMRSVLMNVASGAGPPPDVFVHSWAVELEPHMRRLLGRRLRYGEWEDNRAAAAEIRAIADRGAAAGNARIVDANGTYLRNVYNQLSM